MTSAAATGLETLHPLVQLATFRLLSREGVVASTPVAGGGGGSGGAGGHSSGWLAQKTGGGNVIGGGGSGGGGGGGGGDGGGVGSSLTSPVVAIREAAENTPLGAVLRVSLGAPSRATRAAARALAARALLSLGVVGVPPKRKGRVGGSGGGGGGGSSRGGGVSGGVGEDEMEEEEEEEGVVDGEAGVWLGLLTPGAVGALVVLARDACDNADALMAAGIRAAEESMRGEPLVGVRRGKADVRGGWEVEFR